MVESLSLHFADDIILLSNTVAGLQTQLNIIARKASDLDLHVSLDKSNIGSFRNGVYIWKREMWCYNGQGICQS